ncbi:MAG: DUF2975 domain-containing protein [Thermoplasmata archaeon]|nr:DUF2975 domain-containing protein [Thermoplasmata archaeon]
MLNTPHNMKSLKIIKRSLVVILVCLFILVPMLSLVATGLDNPITTLGNGDPEGIIEFPVGGGENTDLNILIPEGAEITDAEMELRGLGVIGTSQDYTHNYFDTTNNDAWWGMTTQHPPNSAPSTYQTNAFSNQDHVSVRASDNARMLSSAKGNPNYPYQFFRFKITETGITYLNVYWEGYGWYSGISIAHYQAYLYIWNDNNLNWELIGSNSTDIKPIDFVIQYNSFSNHNDYVDDSDYLYVMAQGPYVADNGTYSDLFTDFIEVTTKATGIIYPTNPTLDVGGDGDNEWALPDIFDGKVTIDDNDNFKTELQSLIDSATPGGDYVDIPLKFTSASAGKIKVSNISIHYALNDPPHLTELIPSATFGFYEDTGGGDNLIDLNDYFWDDNDNGSLKFAILKNNEDIHAELDADSHHLDFTSGQDYFGTLEFQVRAIDKGFDGVEGGDTDLYTDSNIFTVTVWPTNDAPVLEAVGGKNVLPETTELEFKGSESAKEDELYNLTIIGHDIDGDALGFVVNKTLAKPAAIYITPDSENPNAAQLSMLATNDYVGFMFLNITVSDNNATGTRAVNPSKGPLTDSIHLKLEVLNTNDPPKLDPMVDMIVDEDTWLNFTITATDDDIIHGDILEFSTNITEAFDGLIQGENYEFDKNSGELSILPDNAMVGVYWVNFGVEDLGEELDEQRVRIIVRNVNDPPVPVISSPLHQQVFNTTTPIYFDAGNSTDDDLIHGDSLTYYWDSNVFGTLGNKENFFITLIDTGWHNITLKATDSSNVEVKTVISVRIVTAAVVDNGNGDDPGDGDPEGVTPIDEESSGDYFGLIIMVIIIVIIILVGVLMFVWQRNKALRELERELELEEERQVPQQPPGVMLPVIQPPPQVMQPILQQPPLLPIPPPGMGIPPPPVIPPQQFPVQPQVQPPPQQPPQQ